MWICQGLVSDKTMMVPEMCIVYEAKYEKQVYQSENPFPYKNAYKFAKITYFELKFSA